jgi:hypothetical protein
MELKEDMEFKHLLEVIRHLPEDKIVQLKAELSIPSSPAVSKSNKNFQELLLKGPIMDDDQYNAYKQTRNHFNKWRTK